MKRHDKTYNHERLNKFCKTGNNPRIFIIATFISHGSKGHGALLMQGEVSTRHQDWKGRSWIIFVC
jgi:hypothetical protein